MQRYTEEASAAGAELWDQLDEEVSDSEFIKSATIAIQEEDVWTGPRIPKDMLIKIGHEFIEMPRCPDDRPEAMLKLAAFWSDAFKSLGRTLRNVITGGGAKPPLTAQDVLDSARVGRAGTRAVVDVDKLKGLFKSTGSTAPTGFQKAQAGLAIAVPATAVAIGAHAWSSGQRRRQHGRVERALMNDPEFENQADKEQAISETYGMMRRYAPSIALDPIVSKSFVKLLISYPDQQNVEIVQNLMEAEKKFQDSREFSTDLRDIQRLTRHPLVSPFGAGGK